jgi:hypothetical protein
VDSRISIFSGQSVNIKVKSPPAHSYYSFLVSKVIFILYQVALNGIDFVVVPDLNIAVQQKKRLLRVLHLLPSVINTYTFDNDEDSGWTRAAHVGILRAAEHYPLSMNYTEIFDVDLSNSAEIELHVARCYCDVVFLWKISIVEEFVNSIAVKYPEIQFVVSSTGNTTAQPQSSDPTKLIPNVISNTNFFFAHMYHARYLTGYLIGLIMNAGKNNFDLIYVY